MRYFFIFLFLSTLLHAETCDDCSPLTEVSITNSGLEKLIALSLDENLRHLDKEISKRADFRPIRLERSQCKTMTISEIWNSKEKIQCYGLPDMNDLDGISGDTKLRPYIAEINNWKLNKVDLALASPVKCEKFVCDFEIKANDLNIAGDLNVKYTDKNETFIPPTTITLKTKQNPDIRMSGQVLIDPKTGKINDLIYLNEKKSKIFLAPGSLTLDMDINTEFRSKEDEIRIKAKNFHRYVPIEKIDAAYIEQQYERMRFHLTVDFERDIEKKRTSEGKPEMKWQQLRALAEKEVDKMIISKYGSIANFKKKLTSIQWPSANDDKATYEFIQNPPPELAVFSEITDKMEFADLAAIGENSGFDNANAFLFTAAAVQIGKQAADNQLVTQDFIRPLIEKEVLPAVQQQVNAELRNLKQYWNQISKIPNLNAQNLKVLHDLKNKHSSSQDENEKAELRKKIEHLENKMKSDWISIDTEVAIDQNTRDGKLLKAQISKSNPNCSDYPKKFSDDDDTDFDIRTEFGVNTLQDYFNRMSQNKNLDLCVDSSNPETCEDGKRLSLKNPPKIGCENGEFTFELDAEAATKILGLDVSADLGAKVKAQIENCSGSPCIQFTDSNGHFKNIFLNTFFGSMLDRGVSSALAKTNNIPVNIPHAKMKKAQTSGNDCSTKLDWSLER